MLERLVPGKTAVFVVDVQERLARVMPESRLAELVRATTVLVETARLLRAPIVATEQYVKGLGPTIEPVRAALDAAGVRPFEKTHFSAMEAMGVPDALRGAGVSDVVVVGMEAHVCVYQTVRDLRADGYRVLVAQDGICSRRDDARATGLDLCTRCGAVPTNAEAVVLDWLRDSAAPDFKAVSQLIR
jgi:nicotinamidase-related amidase